MKKLQLDISKYTSISEQLILVKIEKPQLFYN